MTQKRLAKLDALLQRVALAAGERGKKSELARWLGTTPQQLNDWLSGAYAPGGEVTLLLLEWVTAEEVKTTKSPSGAETPLEQVTPKRSNYEEVPKSGPSRRWPKHSKQATPRRGKKR